MAKELNKCEEELVRNLHLQQRYEDEKAKLNAENRKLANTAESLKQSLEFVEKELNELRGSNTMSHEEQKNVNYYKAKYEDLLIHKVCFSYINRVLSASKERLMITISETS